MEQEDRLRAEEMELASGKEIAKIVKYPQYKKHDVLKVDHEINHPSDKIYIALGWDEDKDTNRKHYR